MRKEIDITLPEEKSKKKKKLTPQEIAALDQGKPWPTMLSEDELLALQAMRWKVETDVGHSTLVYKVTMDWI